MDAQAGAGTVNVICPHCQAINRVVSERLRDGHCGKCSKPLFDGHPIAVGAAEFERHVGSSSLPVVADFWAPWCAPCRAMAPAFEAAAREPEPGFRFVKVNTDEEPELAARHGIRGIPTLAVFRGGRETARTSGAMSAPQFVAWVRANG